MASFSPSKRKTRLNLESLEHRENPAGSITTSLTAGVLTITGGDESSNITADFSGPVVFTANDGENFTNNNLTGTITSIVINMGGGNDTFTTVAASSINAGTGSVSINMGDGNNTLDWSNLSAFTSGPVKYIGGDGDDVFKLQTTAASTITGAFTAVSGIGNLDLTLGTSLAAGMPVTAGVTITNNNGTTLATLEKVTAPKAGLTGNDANKSGDMAKLVLNGSKLTGPVTLSTGYATGYVQVTGGQINGVTINSKSHATFQGTDINYDTGASAAVPTGNITVTSGAFGFITLNQSNVPDCKIGNLKATSVFDSSIQFTGGTIGSGHSKTLGNLSAKSGTYSNTNVIINTATSVGTVLANAAGLGDDAVVSLSNVGNVGAITCLGNDNANVGMSGVGEAASVTASAVGCTITMTNTGKTGAVTATSTTKTATITATTVTQELGAVKATGASTAITLTGVPKTGAVTSTATAPLSTATVTLKGASTGDTVKKTGGNVTVKGGYANLRVDAGGANVVNGNATISAGKYAGELGVFVAGNSLLVEGTTAISGGLGAALNLQLNSANSIFKNNVTVTGTNPLGSVTVNSKGNLATFEKNLTVKTAGVGITDFSSVAVSEVKGDYAYTGGQWQDTFAISQNFQAKNINWNTKNGDTTVTMGALGSSALAPISGTLTILTGLGKDTIALNGVSVAGLTTISTGANSDTVSINNSTLTGISKIDTGAGNDFLNIADQTGATQETKIVGAATYNLGAGTDQLTLGKLTGGDTFTNANFSVPASKIDGGLGADLYVANTMTTLTTGAGQIVGFE